MSQLTPLLRVSPDTTLLQVFVELDDGTAVRARTVVLATGARYRRLDQLDGFDRFEGGGIHYAATAMEAGLVEGEEAVVVGGGNSAGQAAIFLSRAASHVHVLVRGESLAASMSEYLVSRIEAVPERNADLRAFIKATTARCGVEVDGHFGFRDGSLPPEEQRTTGFGLGRFITEAEAAFERATPRRRIAVPRKPGVKLCDSYASYKSS